MLKNKTILITGAASGLGKAWSKKFSDEGAKVFACDINEEGLNELKDYETHTQVIDVSKPEHVQDFIESAHTKSGRVDVLFNNAGMGFGHKVDSFPDGSFEHHVAVHLFGTVYGMRICTSFNATTRIRQNYKYHIQECRNQCRKNFCLRSR